MHHPEDGRDDKARAPEGPDAALKKTRDRETSASTGGAKKGKEAREARLGAALRENLRRRKVAGRKDKEAD